MIQEIIVPIAYFLFFGFIIGSKRFFTSDSISKPVLLIGFSLKVFCSVLYGYLFRNGLLTGDDTYLYFYNGNVVYSALSSDPMIYFRLALGSNDFRPVPREFLAYTDNMHFWFDKANYFIVRLNALIRPFSFGLYDVHAIVFAFLSFIGLYNLYLFFQTKLKNHKLLQFILFGIPSVVFWTSGIHKEAITIFSLGLILYNLERIRIKNYSLSTFFFLFIGLIFLNYVRFYLFVVLLPLLLSMMIIQIFQPKKPDIFVFLLTVGGCLLIAVFIDFLNPRIDMMQAFLVRREYFLRTMPGTMTFPVVSHIPPTISGYLSLIKEAIVNPIFRPFPGECVGYLSVFACIEHWVIVAIIVYLLVSIDFKLFINNPYAIFSIFFGLSILFLIGLIVNNSGAIVRYRSVSIPFILIGLCLCRKKNA